MYEAISDGTQILKMTAFLQIREFQNSHTAISRTLKMCFQKKMRAIMHCDHYSSKGTALPNIIHSTFQQECFSPARENKF